MINNMVSFVISFGRLVFLFGLSDWVLGLDLRVILLYVPDVGRLVLSAGLLRKQARRVRRAATAVGYLQAFLWHGRLGHLTASFV